MGANDELTDKIKKVIRLIAGKLSDTDGPLLPEYKIKGSGIIYCLSADNRKFVKVSRGISAYIIEEFYDTQMRTLIYTIYGDMVLIEHEQLELIGFE